jgi:PEP-CTERM putative exosortase interaction domain
MFADTLFNFSFTGNGTEYGLGATPFAGSGVFDTHETSTAGQYLIVGVTGTTQGQTITKLDAPGTHYTNDNLLFYTGGDASATLDTNGVSYEIPGNYVYLFLDTADATAHDRELIFLHGEDAPISITPAALSAVPEPGTIALLGTGMLGLAGMVRRRFAV